MADRKERVEHFHEIADLKIMREDFIKHGKQQYIMIIDQKFSWHEGNGDQSEEPPAKRKKTPTEDLCKKLNKKFAVFKRCENKLTMSSKLTF